MLHSWWYLPEAAGDPGELGPGDFCGDEAKITESTKIYMGNGTAGEGDPNVALQWFETNGYVGWLFLKGSSGSRWVYAKINSVTQQANYCELDVTYIDDQLGSTSDDFTNGERVWFTWFLAAPAA